MSDTFMLYANCIPVKGSKRSIIYDLQRGKYRFIPNEMYEIIKDRFVDLNNVYDSYGSGNKKTLDEYFKLLIDEEEFGVLISENEKKFYPKLSLYFKTNYDISTIVVEVGEGKVITDSLICELEQLGCNTVVFIQKQKIDDFQSILNHFTNSSIKNIEIFIPNEFHDLEKSKQLIDLNQRVSGITIYCAKKEWLVVDHNPLRQIKYITRNIPEYGKEIAPRKFDFTINLRVYLEAQKHNPYYNKKIFINENGDITNVYQGESFGNIFSTKISDVISKKFKEIWNIPKNKILGCRQCEFRYICLDSRVPVYDELIKEYKYQTECNHDPKNCKWKKY